MLTLFLAGQNFGPCPGHVLEDWVGLGDDCYNLAVFEGVTMIPHRVTVYQL